MHSFIVGQIYFETPFYLLVLTNRINWILISELFAKSILTFLRPSEKSLYNIYNPQGSKLFNRLTLGFGHIRELNLFQANAPFLYPLKTSENLWFSDVFRRYRKETLTWNLIADIILQILWIRYVHVLLKLRYGHLFLRCHNYASLRTALINELSCINSETVSLIVFYFSR